MRSLLLACVGVFYLCASAQAADSLEGAFTRGNRAFGRGDFASAVEAYTTLVDAGVDDADVSFNLASAHGALGHYGEAIRYFSRTLRLRPSDDAAQAGLKKAREALGQRQALETGEAIVTSRPPLTEAVFAGLTTDALAIALLAALLACSLCAGLLLYVKAEGVRLSLGIGTTLALVVSAGATLGLLVKFDWNEPGTRAVVLHDRAALREGPDEMARLARELPEGSSVRILGREAGFMHVRLGEREGYLLPTDVGEI
jgi:tetratricopeptide (TPR) repeat protein